MDALGVPPFFKKPPDILTDSWKLFSHRWTSETAKTLLQVCRNRRLLAGGREPQVAGKLRFRATNGASYIHLILRQKNGSNDPPSVKNHWRFHSFLKNFD